MINFFSKLKNRQLSKFGLMEIKDFNSKNCFEIRDLNLWYNQKTKAALKNINLNIVKNKITALIGPSGCGKSTLLRCLNRMNDYNDVEIEGGIYFLGQNIYEPNYSVDLLRMQVGMVFQKPNPFNFSIFDNVTYSLKAHGIHNSKILGSIVEKSLKQVALYEEVCDDLNQLATLLSGGQQQRLCIARTIACQPDVLLMDEPTSSLDPISVAKVEELIIELAKKYTIIIVSHHLKQVKRISNYVVYMEKGKIVETNNTQNFFNNPQHEKTKLYIAQDH